MQDIILGVSSTLVSSELFDEEIRRDIKYASAVRLCCEYGGSEEKNTGKEEVDEDWLRDSSPPRAASVEGSFFPFLSFLASCGAFLSAVFPVFPFSAEEDGRDFEVLIAPPSEV